RRVGERIPDRAASAVFIDGALDLIGGSGGAPYKAVREAGRGVTVGCWFGLTLFRIRRRGHSECREARKLRKIATRELAEHRPLPGIHSPPIATISRNQFDKQKSCRSRTRPYLGIPRQQIPRRRSTSRPSLSSRSCTSDLRNWPGP